MVSTPLPPICFADTLKLHGGLRSPCYFKRLFMDKIKELFETLVLVSVFVVSILAIAPIN